MFSIYFIYFRLWIILWWMSIKFSCLIIIIGYKNYQIIGVVCLFYLITRRMQMLLVKCVQILMQFQTNGIRFSCDSFTGCLEWCFWLFKCIYGAHKSQSLFSSTTKHPNLVLFVPGLPCSIFSLDRNIGTNIINTTSP